MRRDVEERRTPTLILRRVTLDDGTEVIVRSVGPGDRILLEEGFEHLSDDSRHRRFFRAVKHLTAAELDYFTRVDHQDHEAIGVTTADGEVGLGIARYIRLSPDSDAAEVAIVVLDAVQGRGLGKVLMDQLAEAARRRGIRRFVAQTGSDNGAFVRLMERFGEVDRRMPEPGTLELEVPIV